MTSLIEITAEMLDGISKILQVQGSKYVSVIKVNGNFIIVNSNPEYFKMYLEAMPGLSEFVYRIPIEVFAMVLGIGQLHIDEALDTDGGAILNIYRIIDVDGEEQIPIYTTIPQELDTMEAFVRELLDSYATSEPRKFTELKLIGLFNSVNKAASSGAKGVLVKSGYCYLEGDGVWVYKKIDSDLEDCFTSDCISQLTGFLKANNTEYLQIFRFKEAYNVCVSQYLMFGWRRTRLSTDIAVEEIESAIPIAEYAVDTYNMGVAIRNVADSKIHTVSFTLSFAESKVKIDSPVGKYKLMMRSQLLSGRAIGSIKLRYANLIKVFKSNIAIGMVRVKVYDTFIRFTLKNDLNIVIVRDDIHV